MGADVVAISTSVVEQLFRHPLTDELVAGRER
jgi:hypothetical protein